MLRSQAPSLPHITLRCQPLDIRRVFLIEVPGGGWEEHGMGEAASLVGLGGGGPQTNGEPAQAILDEKKVSAQKQHPQMLNSERAQHLIKLSLSFCA